MEKPPIEPAVGSRDFFYEASAALRDSDTLHVMLCAYSASPVCYRSANIHTVDQLQWIRQQMNRYLDEIEADMSAGQS